MARDKGTGHEPDVTAFREHYAKGGYCAPVKKKYAGGGKVAIRWLKNLASHMTPIEREAEKLVSKHTLATGNEGLIYGLSGRNQPPDLFGDAGTWSSRLIKGNNESVAVPQHYRDFVSHPSNNRDDLFTLHSHPDQLPIPSQGDLSWWSGISLPDPQSKPRQTMWIISPHYRDTPSMSVIEPIPKPLDQRVDILRSSNEVRGRRSRRTAVSPVSDLRREFPDILNPENFTVGAYRKNLSALDYGWYANELSKQVPLYLDPDIPLTPNSKTKIGEAWPHLIDVYNTLGYKPYADGGPVEMAGGGALRAYLRKVIGKPETVKIPGHGIVDTEPLQPVDDAVTSYLRSIGRTPEDYRISEYPAFDEDRARRIGAAYEEMPHEPSRPDVRRAYDALIDETMGQYRALKDAGYDFEFIPHGMPDPYAASPALGYVDLRDRGHLWTFPTDSGFGTLADIDDNPLLRRVGRVGNLPDATANDAFRVVHDMYGHFGPGNPFFRHKGEERAWLSHRGMFSPEAIPALTSETRGQNSWLNFGPYGEQNRGASALDTIYADQKTGMLPPFTWTEYKDGGIVKKARKPIKNALRTLFPGIWDDPDIIATMAAERTAPESSALKQLWGYDRQEMFDKYGARKGNMPASSFVNFGLRPRGNEAAQNIMTEGNAQRLLDILAEGDKRAPELSRGMQSWYAMDPVYDRLVDLHGIDEGGRLFRDFNVFTGASSAGSEVMDELRRGAAANKLYQEGRFSDWILHGGIPAAERQMPELADVPGHSYHRTAQLPTMMKYIESGEIPSASPKVPMYIGSSSVPDLGFQSDFPVMDSHFSRGIGLADVRPAKTQPVQIASAERPELYTVGPWFRDQVASPFGIESVPAQARLWGLLSHATGVNSPIGSPKLELLSQLIEERAARLGIPIEKARDLIISGQAFADGGPVKMQSGGPLAKYLRGLSKPIRAYHGSPHDFDRFDSSKIGTGEGAQVYGHGMYFAENPEVAKFYRNTLAGTDPVWHGPAGRVDKTDIPYDVLNKLFGMTDEDIVKSIEAYPTSMMTDPNTPASLRDVRNVLAGIETGRPRPESGPHLDIYDYILGNYERRMPGRSYEVAIHEDPTRFLHLNKPLGEQGATGRRAYDWWNQLGHFFSDGSLYGIDDVDPGHSAFIHKSFAHSAPDLGISGTRYLDANSRRLSPDDPNATHNYVVFPGMDDIVEITRKYADGGSVDRYDYGETSATDVEQPELDHLFALHGSQNFRDGGKVTALIKYLQKLRGAEHGRRAEQAADLGVDLGLYSKGALKEAFHDTGPPLVVMHPGEFENFAWPLSRTGKSGGYGRFGQGSSALDKYIDYLASTSQKKGMSEVPWLGFDARGKHEVPDDWFLQGFTQEAELPAITTHEGRHRMRAFDRAGEEASLVQLFPEGPMKYGPPSDYVPRWQEFFGAGEVLPQAYDDPTLKALVPHRNVGLLPPLFADGGRVDDEDFALYGSQYYGCGGHFSGKRRI